MQKIVIYFTMTLNAANPRLDYQLHVTVDSLHTWRRFAGSALEGIDERSLSSVHRLEPILRSAEDLSRRYRLFVGENKMAANVGDAAR